MTLKELGIRLFRKDDRHTWAAHVRMIRDLRAWERQLERYPVIGSAYGDVVAYVANFRRPQNIRPIVRSLLASRSVGRIIVSNNNPDCILERWFTPSQDRVSVLSHAEPQNCFMRYVHLQPFAGARNLIIDDDVFLLPPQIDTLCDRLKENPSVPHGLYGQRWDGERFLGGIQRVEDGIDVISRVYAFTDRHLHGVLDTVEPLKAAFADIMHAGWSDDIMLSCSGSGLPRIHDAGPLVDCPTQGAKGIATWRNDGFHASRTEIFKRVRALSTIASA